jgi:hypothetical protein
VDDRGISEADVDGSRPCDTVESPVQSIQSVLPRLFRPRLHIRLIDLHDVGAGRENLLGQPSTTDFCQEPPKFSKLQGRL